MLLTERQLRKIIRNTILLVEDNESLEGPTGKPSSKPSDEDELLYGKTTAPEDDPEDELLGKTTAVEEDPEDDIESRIDSIENKVDKIIKVMKEKMK